jgi:hypothetical protein
MIPSGVNLWQPPLALEMDWNSRATVASPGRRFGQTGTVSLLKHLFPGFPIICSVI